MQYNTHIYIYIYVCVGGTVSAGGEQQCIHRQVAPPRGTGVDMMRVEDPAVDDLGSRKR